MDEQLTLTTEWVDLTQEEQIQQGHELADSLRALRLMEQEHADRKKDMKDQITALEQHIALVAQIVRTGKEERPIANERDPRA